MRRWPHLDGLRGLAALLVVLTHVSFWTGESARSLVGAIGSRGDVGVAIFFALSAFLLSGAWWGDEHADTLSYAVRRFVRIVPAYLVALGVVVLLTGAGVVAVAGMPGENPPVGVGGPGKVVAHLLLAQGYTGDFYQAFSQTWSLTTEVGFYVLLPFVVLALRTMRRTEQWVAIGAFAVLGLVVQGIAVEDWVPALGRSPLGHAAWFAAGLAVRLVLLSPTPVPARVARAAPWFALAAAAVAATPVAGPRMFAATTAPEAVAKELLYALVAGGLLLAAVHPTRGVGWLAGRRWRWLGTVSYGIFLWHLVVLQVGYAATGHHLFQGGFLVVLLGTVAGSVLLGWGSWLAVERTTQAMARLALKRRQGAAAS